MGRANSKLPSFCLSRVATRVRVRPPQVDSNPVPAAARVADKVEGGGEVTTERRRVMVAVDSSMEAKSALLWALSHAVQSNDILVLLKVAVELLLVEGTDRGAAIVGEARRQRVSLLVLGQKKRSITWSLLMMWAGGKLMASGGVVDHCVHNSPCMTLAVRRKSRRGGGFLITTRRHKDFWLLA